MRTSVRIRGCCQAVPDRPRKCALQLATDGSHSDKLFSTCGVYPKSGIKLSLGGASLHCYSNALNDFSSFVTDHVRTKHQIILVCEVDDVPVEARHSSLASGFPSPVIDLTVEEDESPNSQPPGGNQYEVANLQSSLHGDIAPTEPVLPLLQSLRHLRVLRYPPVLVMPFLQLPRHLRTLHYPPRCATPKGIVWVTRLQGGSVEEASS